jgi:hypothetical protein
MGQTICLAQRFPLQPIFENFLASNEIVALNLIIERSPKGEVLELTNRGYQIAEMIAQ